MFLISAIVCMGEGVTLNCTATSELTLFSPSPIHGDLTDFFLFFFFLFLYPLTFRPQHSIFFFLFKVKFNNIFKKEPVTHLTLSTFSGD